MRSALYEGSVYHRRLSPKKHAFSYKLFMMYLDLDELDKVLSLSRFCSRTRWAPLQFRRKDFHGCDTKPVKSEIYKTVKEKIGLELDGPVSVLNNWRCFGVSFNPLSTYYCFDKTGQYLRAIVAEVTNTPWLERHAYVIAVDEGVGVGSSSVDTMLEKVFTVSPFNPVNMSYHWRSTLPDDSISISIDNYLHDRKVFEASIVMKRKVLSASSIRANVLVFPFITLKVVVSIYWQALRLFAKGIPFLGKDKVAKSV